MSTIEITESAQTLFTDLVADEPPGTCVRIFVEHPGTTLAETRLVLCPPEERDAGDVAQQEAGFTLLVEQRSAPFLEGARIDLGEDELIIRAPNVRERPVPSDAPLHDRVQYMLDSEINPALASHGGMVSLVELRDGTAVLRFGGGCSGCAQVDVTLKEGVERGLLERFPDELKAVADVTDHAAGTNPYYPRP